MLDVVGDGGDVVVAGRQPAALAPVGVRDRAGRAQLVPDAEGIGRRTRGSSTSKSVAQSCTGAVCVMEAPCCPYWSGRRARCGLLTLLRVRGHRSATATSVTNRDPGRGSASPHGPRRIRRGPQRRRSAGRSIGARCSRCPTTDPDRRSAQEHTRTGADAMTPNLSTTPSPTRAGLPRPRRGARWRWAAAAGRPRRWRRPGRRAGPRRQLQRRPRSTPPRPSGEPPARRAPRHVAAWRRDRWWRPPHGRRPDHRTPRRRHHGGGHGGPGRSGTSTTTTVVYSAATTFKVVSAKSGTATASSASALKVGDFVARAGHEARRHHRRLGRRRSAAARRPARSRAARPVTAALRRRGSSDGAHDPTSLSTSYWRAGSVGRDRCHGAVRSRDGGPRRPSAHTGRCRPCAPRR